MTDDRRKITKYSCLTCKGYTFGILADFSNYEKPGGECDTYLYCRKCERRVWILHGLTEAEENPNLNVTLPRDIHSIKCGQCNARTWRIIIESFPIPLHRTHGEPDMIFMVCIKCKKRHDITTGLVVT